MGDDAPVKKKMQPREKRAAARLFAFIRDGGLWTVGAEYKKSRRALSVLTADTLRFLNVATAGRPPFRSRRRVSFSADSGFRADVGKNYVELMLSERASIYLSYLAYL